MKTTFFYVHLSPTGQRSGPLSSKSDVGTWIEDNWKDGETKRAKVSTEDRNLERMAETYKVEEQALEYRLKQVKGELKGIEQHIKKAQVV